jgi:nanoRNase/pAp phosphatase (c-di-AMP/oligoRNAs hydrolase)
MDLPIKPRACLYYYQGNFFHPIDLPGSCVGLVKGAIRKFMKEKKALVAADRAHPEYKTLVQLFDEQFPNG